MFMSASGSQTKHRRVTAMCSLALDCKVAGE